MNVDWESMRKNDWRLLRGQEKYLLKEKLYKCKWSLYSPNDDHDHCEFCMDKFWAEGMQYGYCTIDKYTWICESCFNEFKELFEWEIEELC